MFLNKIGCVSELKIKAHFILFYFAFHSTFTIFIQVPHPAELGGVKVVTAVKAVKVNSLVVCFNSNTKSIDFNS